MSPRFAVTAEFNKGKAEQDLKSFADLVVSTSRAANKAVSEAISGKSTGAADSATKGLERQGRAVKGVNKEYDDMINRLKIARGDVSKIGSEINSTQGIKRIGTEIEAIRTSALKAQASLGAVGSEGYDATKAAQFATVIDRATKELEKFYRVQRGAKPLDLVDKSYIQNVKGLNDVMNVYETNRKNGIGTLTRYRQELLAIKSAADARVNNPALSQAERGAYGSASQRAAKLVNDADLAQAKKLEGAIVRINDLLTREKLTAEQASKALSSLADQAGKLATSQNVSNAAAERYLLTQQKLKAAASSAAGGDQELVAAQKSSLAIRDLTAQRRAGILSLDQYKAKLIEQARAAQTEAQNTQRSAAAIREYAAAAGAARVALERLKREQQGGAGGGNSVFALNSIAFAGAGATALGTQFLTSALELNEKAKMAEISLRSAAKFYGLGGEAVAEAAAKTAADIRLNQADVSQAMTFLIKAGFNAEMAARTIKRASDSAIGNALDPNKAVNAAAQGLQQGRSVLLNTAGIEENIGPEIQRMERAIKKGEEYYRTVFITNKEVREQFDINRKNGQAFREAADAAGRFQFVLKATQVDAGRTAESTKTLTAALSFFKKTRDEAKVDLLEGAGKIVTPGINVASDLLVAFKGLPEVVKSTLGVTAALAVLTLGIVSTAAAGFALTLQISRSLAAEGILNATRLRAVTILGTLRSSNLLFSASMNSTAFATARNIALTNLATGATNIYTGAVTRLGAALNFVKANPFVALLGVVLAGAIAAKAYADQTEQIYADTEEADKKFHDQMVERNGQEFVDKLAQLQIYLEARAQLQAQLADAKTPEERDDIQAKIDRFGTVIDLRRQELGAIRQSNEAAKGSSQATLEQAENYRVLKDALDAVAERYGDMKLTTFQKDLRALQKEQERQVAAIDKGAREYIATEKASGIDPKQEAILRAKAAALIPQGTAGLVAREIEEARKSAASARQAMEREQNDLVKDGVARRKTLLKLDTRQVQEEYAERLKIVRANLKDPNLNPNEPGIDIKTRETRQAQLRSFANAEQGLIRERDGKIKLLEAKTTQDLITLRRDRSRALQDITRSQVDAEIRQLGLIQKSLDTGRDQALTRTDDGGRVAVEQAFATRSIALTERTARLQSDIQKAAAQRTYEDAILQAATLGEKRAAAEKAARANLASELKSIEIDSSNTVTDARIAGEERVQAARGKLIQTSVDRELEAIGEVEGAQLLALQRRYSRELELARRRGDQGAVDTFTGGLKAISAESVSRTKSARDLVKQAGDEVDGLNEKLAELAGRAAKGLQGAQVAAKKPFNDFIKEREKEVKALNEARAKLVGSDPVLTKSIDDRVRQLGSYITQAAGERSAAVNRATQAFNQAEFDKAVKSAADTAAKIYDNGEGNAAAYQAALETERSYWGARLSGLDRGASDYESQYETINGRIIDIDKAAREARLLAAAQPLELARNKLTSNESQAALARTEDQRNQLLADRIKLLQQVVALETARANNPELSRADRTTAAQNAQQAIAQLQGARVAQGSQAAGDLRVLLAQVDAQRELAQGDAQRAALDARRLLLAQGIAALDAAALQNNTLTLEQRRAAEQQSLASSKAVRDIQGQIRDSSAATLKSLTDLASAQLDYAATAATSEAAITRAMQDRLALVRAQVTDQDTLIQQAIQRGDSEASINGLKAARLGLLGQELTGERELAARPLKLAQERLTAEKGIAEARLAGSQLAGDELATAQLGLSFAERELTLAREKLRLAQDQGGEANISGANLAVLQAENEVLKDRNALIQAPIQAEQRRNALLTAQQALQASIAGNGQDAVVQAGLKVAAAERELNVADQLVAAASTRLELEAALQKQAEARTVLLGADVEFQKAQTARSLGLEGRQSEIANAQKQYAAAQKQYAAAQQQYASAELKAARDLLDVGLKRASIEAILNDTAGDKVKSAQAELDANRARLAQLQGRNLGGLSPDERAGVLREQLDLIGQVATGERQLAQARVEAESNLLDIVEARQKAARRILGVADDSVQSAREDLDLARERLALTQQQVATPGLGREDRAKLLSAEVEQLGQVADAQRKLTDAQRAGAALAQSLTISEAGLRLELAGGTAETRSAAEAALALSAARLGVRQAADGLAEARATGDQGKIKTATEALTGAIVAQRGAASKLADTYTGLLSSMGAVQSAAAELQKVVYGENGAKFDSNREIDRLTGIEQRRNAAIAALQEALKTGDKAAIATSTQALATQEKRYRDQVALLNKSGVRVSLSNERVVEGLSRQVDDLGIEYDREAVIVQQRLDAAQREAQAAITFEAGVSQFATSTAELLAGLTRVGELQALNDVPAPVGESVIKALGAASDQLGSAIQGVLGQAGLTLFDARLALIDAGKAFRQSTQNAAPPAQPRRFDEPAVTKPPTPPKAPPAFSREFAAMLTALTQRRLPISTSGLQAGISAGIQGGLEAARKKADTVQPNKTEYNTWNVDVTVNGAPGQSADAIADITIRKLEDRARRQGRNC